MSVEQLRPLKQSLLSEYGHFSDQRLKKIDSHGADRKLYPWFCLIFADVIEPNAVQVKMRGGIPRSAAVEKWIRENGADDEKYGLSFSVTPHNVGKLSLLAKAVQSIVQAPYPVKAYKYVCPRTAASLERLHATLSKHWAIS